ncbi:hypothetical protein F5144DRAFT_547682 [Chaetomium tenue]|uniref:Uncharacterized protein n=1 Tax=Chaetomium tenue TaxID=1854479 RepID=A0ACB7PBN9_9PEZI|nr:hypothetical protein F5144DRAFT_547682 [Chaetomium globosum]
MEQPDSKGKGILNIVMPTLSGTLAMALIGMYAVKWYTGRKIKAAWTNSNPQAPYLDLESNGIQLPPYPIPSPSASSLSVEYFRVPYLIPVPPPPVPSPSVPSQKYKHLRVDVGSTKRPEDEWQLIPSLTRRSIICLDGFEDESLVCALPCYHVFHAVCIADWFNTERDTCPLCKARCPRGGQVQTVLPAQPQRAVLPA